MSAFWVGVLVSVVTGALVNEFCDVAPWLARHVIRCAALLWARTDSSLASGYLVEWAAVVEDCPGKLTKLVLALRFLLGAVARRSLRAGRSLRVSAEPFFARLAALTVLCSSVASTAYVLLGPLGALLATGVAASATTATAAVIAIRSRRLAPGRRGLVAVQRV